MVWGNSRHDSWKIGQNNVVAIRSSSQLSWLVLWTSRRVLSSKFRLNFYYFFVFRWCSLIKCLIWTSSTQHWRFQWWWIVILKWKTTTAVASHSDWNSHSVTKRICMKRVGRRASQTRFQATTHRPTGWIRPEVMKVLEWQSGLPVLVSQDSSGAAELAGSPCLHRTVELEPSDCLTRQQHPKLCWKTVRPWLWLLCWPHLSQTETGWGRCSTNHQVCFFFNSDTDLHFPHFEIQPFLDKKENKDVSHPAANVNPFTPTGMLLTSKKRTRSKRSLDG